RQGGVQLDMGAGRLLSRDQAAAPGDLLRDLPAGIAGTEHCADAGRQVLRLLRLKPQPPTLPRSHSRDCIAQLTMAEKGVVTARAGAWGDPDRLKTPPATAEIQGW